MATLPRQATSILACPRKTVRMAPGVYRQAGWRLPSEKEEGSLIEYPFGQASASRSFAGSLLACLLPGKHRCLRVLGPTERSKFRGDGRRKLCQTP